MKRHFGFIILTVLVLYPLTIQGQEQAPDAVYKSGEIRTLFHQPTSNGGYGALSFGITGIDGHTTFISGIKGGWLINHSFVLGLAGYGFINNLEYSTNSNEHALTGGYGGLLLEMVLWPQSPVHLSLPLIIGGGGLVYLRDYPVWDFYEEYPGSAYFIVVPGAELELNIVKFFRLSLGVDYRITPDIHLYDRGGQDLVAPGVMRGFSGHLALKFGKF